MFNLKSDMIVPLSTGIKIIAGKVAASMLNKSYGKFFSALLLNKLSY